METGAFALPFEIACGSVIGKEHRRIGKNNQDALFIDSRPSTIVATVADGCGSSPHSEVGAKLMLPIFARILLNQVERYIFSFPPEEIASFRPFDKSLWERVRLDTLAQMRVIANSMGESLSKTVNDYFLFTVVGVLITPGSASFFSIGDGVIIVNGEVLNLGPFPDNAPPYLGYEITGTSVTYRDPNYLKLLVLEEMPIEELESFLLGTDGVIDLISASDELLPGRDVSVGVIDELWEKDRYFRNPQNVQRWLNLVNQDVARLGEDGQSLLRDHGRLADDTTLIVGRRKRTGGEDR